MDEETDLMNNVVHRHLPEGLPSWDEVSAMSYEEKLELYDKQKKIIVDFQEMSRADLNALQNQVNELSRLEVHYQKLVKEPESPPESKKLPKSPVHVNNTAKPANIPIQRASSEQIFAYSRFRYKNLISRPRFRN